MIKLPVRIELLVRSPIGSVCSFTIPYSFVLQPFKGDNIIFDDIYMTVTQCVHYSGENQEPAIAVVARHTFDKYDELLRSLDWFKSNYEVQDLSAKEKPASYYSFYRSLLRLLSWSNDFVLPYKDDYIKLFCEGCRTVLLAERFIDTDTADSVDITADSVNELFSLYNPHILDLTNMILEKKKVRVNDQDGIDILNLIHEWESQINPDIVNNWSASLEICQQVGRIVFGRIRSISNDVLPEFLY